MQFSDVSINFLGHSGFLIRNGVSIAIDPYGVSAGVGKVDYIFITHNHYDHCSIKDIQQLSKPGTVIVAHPDAQSKLTHVNGVHLETIQCGDELAFGALKVEAVPAYNPKKNYHPKSEGWMGYVLKLGSVIVYHAGDTDLIPEMQKLTGYGKHGQTFVALLPVSGTYVMDVEEAVRAAALLKPSYAIPMHYGAGVVGTVSDAERFVRECKEQGVHAEVLEKL